MKDAHLLLWLLFGHRFLFLLWLRLLLALLAVVAIVLLLFALLFRGLISETKNNKGLKD